MKKLIALISAVCLCCALVACGSETPSTDNSSTPSSDNSATTVSVSDFVGCWKLDNDKAKTIKINAENNTVTAWDANGYVISTFPVVATENGLVLKMGTLGEVTLEDPTTLTITTEPVVSKHPEVIGKYSYITGDLPADTALEIKSDGKYTLSGSKSDYGPYTYSNMSVTLKPTVDLLYDVEYKIIGGGKILYDDELGRVFVKDSAKNDKVVKTVANQYHLVSNEWTANDNSMSVQFTENGKLLLAGAEAGLWSPTEKGAIVEYSDGQSDTLEITNGSFTLNYYGKTFVK